MPAERDGPVSDVNPVSQSSKCLKDRKNREIFFSEINILNRGS